MQSEMVRIESRYVVKLVVSHVAELIGGINRELAKPGSGVLQRDSSRAVSLQKPRVLPHKTIRRQPTGFSLFALILFYTITDNFNDPATPRWSSCEFPPQLLPVLQFSFGD
jgi:hypothetical protein